MGRPRVCFKKISKTPQEGTLEGETRATFIVKEESLDLIKGLAKLEHKRIKDVVNEAFEFYFSSKRKNSSSDASAQVDRGEYKHGS